MSLGRITFNNGATFWYYDTPKRLEQIKAFQSRQLEHRKFSPARCIEATLAEERKLYLDDQRLTVMVGRGE